MNARRWRWWALDRLAQVALHNYVLSWTKDMAVSGERRWKARAHRGGRQTRYPEEQRRRERSQREGEDKAEQSATRTVRAA